MGRDGQNEEHDEDPDFEDSDNDLEFEDDDQLYDLNVTDGIEVRLVCPDGLVEDAHEEGSDVEVGELEYPSSDELLSQRSSDDEGGHLFPEFDDVEDMMNPQFQVGQIFSSAKVFRDAVRTYGALNGYNLKFKPNEDRRVQGLCKVGCKWRIWASVMNETGALQVKSYTSEHTCSRDKYNRHCNYIFLTNRYIDQFKVDPNWKTDLILATVKKDLSTEISRNVAWKMRRYAKDLLVGTMEDQFRMLRSYAAEVLRTNVGSTVIIALQKQVFKGIYICFSCCKMGFKNGCRKVIGVDGCHLRGSFGGILLTAVGIDANNCIYPIAYAVVEKENTYTWRWFMKYLADDVEMGNGHGWTLMTDRQKGLQNVTDEMFPEAEHRFCVRHMYTNFFSKGFKSKILKNYLWRAAKSTTLPEFRHWLQQIRNHSEEAHGWLVERSPKEWSRSHFALYSKCDILLNNGCEVFNKTLREDRERMILSMLTSIQLTFMNRIRKRRDTMMRYTGRLCPKISKKLKKISEMSRECSLQLSGGPKWQVQCSYGTFVVDIQERTCACRKWELTGIPCMHAISVIRELRNDPEDYVDNCYTTETYMACYSSILNPINGMRLWPEVDMMTIIPPLWTVPRKGKRQINRRKGADEDGIAHSQEKTYLRKKGRLRMTCSICGLRGHNMRYHSKESAPKDDWFEGHLEPVDTHHDIQVNERGKLTAAKKMKGQNVQNVEQESDAGNYFQFMATPMVARDAQAEDIRSGPPATVLQQTLQYHIPWEEVDFIDTQGNA